MFVRVERRKSPRQYFGARFVFRLVRTERQGKRVRQVPVAYLGSIQEKRLTYTFPRLDLWNRAEAALARLSLPVEEQERVRSQLARFVSAPTTEEREAEARALQAAEARLAKSLG